MKTIGVINEGVSDFGVLETIISRYLGDEFLCNAVQPKLRVEKGIKIQSGEGGWSRVIDHCTEETIMEILSQNDYILIQIDTDRCNEYGVNPLDGNNKKKEDVVLYDEITERLVPATLRNLIGSRILFAICFNEIECWLLPLYYTDNRCKSNHNCLFLLNQMLRKKNESVISEIDKNSLNSQRAYRDILKKINKRKIVEDISEYNYGFKMFVAGMKRIEDDQEGRR